MSKEYDCDWDTITSLNIITFNHRLKFLEHKINEIKKSKK